MRVPMRGRGLGLDAALVAHGSPGPFADAWKALLKDLNAPGALGAVFSVIKEADAAASDAATARQSWLGLWFILDALGLTLPVADTSAAAEAPAEVQQLAAARWAAKAAKNWAEADVLRQQIAAAGWVIKDSKEGYEIVKG